MTDPASTTFFVDGRRDLKHARASLERAEIPFSVKRWQPGMWEISVPADADVSTVLESCVREAD